jgi:hypothetical protein
MAHRHKAIAAKAQTRGWSFCVTPDRCAANPQYTEAHGNVTVTDHCACGATRMSESNGGMINYAPWSEAEGK